MQISHIYFSMKILRLSARVGTLVLAVAKWPVSSQKKLLLGFDRRSWLLGERVPQNTVDLKLWEATNLDLLYPSVTGDDSLFRSSCTTSPFWISRRMQWRKEWADLSSVSATFLHGNPNSIGNFPMTIGIMVCSKLPATPAASKLVRWTLTSSTISLILATSVMLRIIGAFGTICICLAITLSWSLKRRCRAVTVRWQFSLRWVIPLMALAASPSICPTKYENLFASLTSDLLPTHWLKFSQKLAKSRMLPSNDFN